MLYDIPILMTILAWIAIGSLAGEFYRGTNIKGPVSISQSVASLFAGAFLSALFALVAHSLTNNVLWAIVVGGFLSFNDVEYVAKIGSSFVEYFLHKKGIIPKNDDDNKKEKIKEVKENGKD